MPTRAKIEEIGDVQDIHDLRAAVIGLDKNQTVVMSVLQSVSETLKEFRNEFGKLEDRVSESNRTKWSNIYGAVGIGTTLMIVLGGLVSYFYSDNISRNDRRLNMVSEKLDHHTHDGHPATTIAAIRGLRDILAARVEAFKDVIEEGNNGTAQARQQTREELSRVEKDVNDRINRLEQTLENK